MIVLALDTCLGASSAAVIRDGRTLGAISEPMTRGHQERLAPLVESLMQACGVGFADLDRIGVTVGPGSFTGLRVGLAFAKGLALALRRPCVGVATLAALASEIEAPGPSAAVIDAGRGRVYLDVFDGARSVCGPRILPLDEAISLLREFAPAGELTLAGPGAALVAVALSGALLVDRLTPDPAIVARLAAIGPGAPPVPLYLRPPDATAKA